MPARDRKGKILTGELLQNRFRIESLLGEGAQGAVYRASHTGLSGKRVAIKETFSDDPASIKAFEREAALLAHLDHRVLPRVTDYFPEDNSYFLVMEFIEGKSLWDLMEIRDNTGKGTTLDILSVAQWGDDLLDALDYMHKQKEPVIHKDIKPGNISVTQSNQVKLLDFGLAKGAVGELTAMKTTLLHGFSPWYASPEQMLRPGYGPFYDLARRSLRIEEIESMTSQGTDARSDLYSLAATLYHCLTGEPPEVSVIRLVALSSGNPDPLRSANEVNAKVDPAIASVLTRAMTLDRDSRFESAKAMQEALREALIPTVALSIASPPPSFIDVFEFETATLNAKGEVTNRGKGQARYLIEDLGGVTIEMVEIPGGEFMMGTTDAEVEQVRKEYERYGSTAENVKKWSLWETPQHKVRVSPFYMGKYQVTQAEWRAVAALSKVNRDLEPDPSNFKGDRLPVESVSWEDAVEFCERLSKATGKKYRLPTEAEWEYASRAGTTTPFAFGETITSEWVNYDGNYPYANAPKGEYREKTTSVGSLGVANGFGLYDMHGNVWEWCMDWFSESYYRESTSDDPTGPTTGSDRVLRGGGWGSDARGCRSAARNRLTPTYRADILGFRLMRTLR